MTMICSGHVTFGRSLRTQGLSCPLGRDRDSFPVPPVPPVTPRCGKAEVAELFQFLKGDAAIPDSSWSFENRAGLRRGTTSLPWVEFWVFLPNGKSISRSPTQQCYPPCCPARPSPLQLCPSPGPEEIFWVFLPSSPLFEVQKRFFGVLFPLFLQPCVVSHHFPTGRSNTPLPELCSHISACSQKCSFPFVPRKKFVSFWPTIHSNNIYSFSVSCTDFFLSLGTNQANKAGWKPGCTRWASDLCQAFTKSRQREKKTTVPVVAKSPQPSTAKLKNTPTLWYFATFQGCYKIQFKLLDKENLEVIFPSLRKRTILLFIPAVHPAVPSPFSSLCPLHHPCSTPQKAQTPPCLLSSPPQMCPSKAHPVWGWRKYHFLCFR